MNESLQLKNSMLKRHAFLFGFYIIFNATFLSFGVRYVTEDSNPEFKRIFIVIKELFELIIISAVLYNLRARRWPAYFSLNVPSNPNF